MVSALAIATAAMRRRRRVTRARNRVLSRANQAVRSRSSAL